MATYLAKCVPNFSEVTGKFRKLLRADMEFRWEDSIHGMAFRHLKQMLASAPVLSFVNVKKSIVIQCDASGTGLGEVLMQEGKIIEYMSYSLTQRQRDSLATIEKETPAIVHVMTRWDTYVFAGSLISS